MRDEQHPLILRGDRCRCSVMTGGCGENFNSTAAFDKHRTWAEGKVLRRCLTVEEMLQRGMAKNATGYWVTKLKDVDHHHGD
jgi:hypothetical protein